MPIAWKSVSASHCQHRRARGCGSAPQIDHLVVNFPETPPPPATTPPPPAIRIDEPVNGAQRALPYQVHLRGSITVQGGLAAFCYRINAPTPNGNDCRNNTDLRPDNTFDIRIPDGSLGGGTNTLAVTVYDFWGQRTTQSVSVTALAPPPPAVIIYTPTNNQWIDPARNNALSGTVGTVGALKGFCVRIDATADPAPNTCSQDLDAIKSTNTAWQPLFFTTPLTPNRLTTGQHRISVFAVDRWDQMGRADVSVSTPTDFRIVAMEITQGIQTFDIPLNINGVAPYTGVNLHVHVPTVVRVFANTPFAGSYRGVGMLLNGFVPDSRFGEKPLGSLLPDSSPATVSIGNLSVPPSVRADPAGGFVFTLPNSWTEQNGLRLQAKLLLPFGAQECPTCTANNDFSVVGINFGGTVTLKIAPVAITFTDVDGAIKSPPPPAGLFAPAINISPVPAASATILPYVGTIDVSDLVGPGGSCRQWTTICESRIYSRMRIFESQHPQDAYWLGVGPVDVGYTVSPIAIANSNLLITAVAHEFYHNMGYFHASGCGTNANLYNYWPPDEKGFIHGVGLDRRMNLVDSTGAWTGRYTLFMPGSAGMAVIPGGQADYYDLMSYCADESDAWISVENWNSFGNVFPNGLFPNVFIYGAATATVISGATASAQKQDMLEAAGSALLANAALEKDGHVQILSVARAGNKILRAPQKSEYVFAVRDSRGVEIARVPALVQINTGHHGEGNEARVLLSAVVPAKDAVSITVEHAGKTIAERQRSKSAPSVQVASSEKEASISRTGQLDVKWIAKDDDGDTLEIRLEFSEGPDKPFRPLFIGPNRGSWKVDGRLLSTTNHGRLRIVANDGFNETEKVVEPIVVSSASPSLDILSPANGMTFPDSTPIRLQAVAFGDGDAPLAGEQIRWSLDGSSVGTGREVEVRDLKPGKHVVKAVATEGKLTTTKELALRVTKSTRDSGTQAGAKKD